MCWWPIFRKLGTCTTTDALSPRTLLTENICESVQQIFQHSPAKRKKRKKVQLTKDDAFLYWSSSCAVCWWPIFRKLGTCSTTDVLSPRTFLTKKICESVQQILQHSPAKKKRKKKVQLTKYDAFLYWSSSCAVCWCPIFRKLGTYSTTDALSPRTLLTENICESVQQILQHSPAKKKKKKKKRKKNTQLTKDDAFLYWSSSCPMWWWATARKLGGCYSGLFHFGGLLA